MSAVSPADQLAWLSEYYPLPEGWVWCRLWGEQALFEAVLTAQRWISIRVGVRDGQLVVTRAFGPDQATEHPPVAVVEQVLAVARLDPAEVGRPRDTPEAARAWDVLARVAPLVGGPLGDEIREGLASRAVPTAEDIARACEEIHRMPLIPEPRAALGVSIPREVCERLIEHLPDLLDDAHSWEDVQRQRETDELRAILRKALAGEVGP